MKLLELFDSRDKKKRLSHIRNLISLACIDGQIDKNELDLIFRIAIRGGLTPEEFKRIVDRPDSVSFTPPDNYRERIEQLYDMVLVMMIDGEIHEKEIALCKLSAIRLGFKHQVIDKMIHDIIDSIAKGIAADIALSMLFESVAV